MRLLLFSAVWLLPTCIIAAVLFRLLFRSGADFNRQLKEFLTPGFIHCLRGMCHLGLNPHVRILLLITGVFSAGTGAQFVARMLMKGP